MQSNYRIFHNMFLSSPVEEAVNFAMFAYDYFVISFDRYICLDYILGRWPLVGR